MSGFNSLGASSNGRLSGVGSSVATVDGVREASVGALKVIAVSETALKPIGFSSLALQESNIPSAKFVRLYVEKRDLFFNTERRVLDFKASKKAIQFKAKDP